MEVHPAIRSANAPSLEHYAGYVLTNEWKRKQKEGYHETSKLDMDNLVQRFIANTFGQDILAVTPHDQQLMINSLIQIVFSHRYSKGDRFIVEAENETSQGIDFNIVRDCMYKYSKKAQDRYFSYPIEAFWFAAFSLSDEGNKFLRSKPDN